MSFSTPTAPVLPASPAAPPTLTPNTPQGTKPQAKPSQPTFLGADLVANSSQAQTKTLLGS